MHRKNVLLVQDSLGTVAACGRVAASLDVECKSCQTKDLTSFIEGFDLVVIAVDALKAGHLSELERIFTQAGGVACLLIVDEDALPLLRLPAHIPVDFALADAGAEELAVRMRHLLWPGEETASSDFITVDGMTINLSTYQVQVDGQPVDFTYLEYALLAFLVTHPGHAYSRDVLLRRVWGFEYYGGSRTVDVHVRRVRAKLGAELATRLETVRGVGYLWSM